MDRVSKVAFATYIDNQEIIDYPVKFLMEQIPDLMVFVSDHAEADYLRSQGVNPKHNFYIINQKIKSPLDISKAQNTCVNAVFAHGFDFVVWVQADMYPTAEAMNIVKRVCVPGNEDVAYGLTVRHLRLFHVSTINNWGVTILGNKCPDRFMYDGAHVGTAGNPAIGGPDAVIDIGYLSITQYKNHLRQHVKTWNSDNHNYLLTDEEFVKEIVDYNKKNVGLYDYIQKDSLYYKIVKSLNMEAEYEKVKQIMNYN